MHGIKPTYTSGAHPFLSPKTDRSEGHLCSLSLASYGNQNPLMLKGRPFLRLGSAPGPCTRGSASWRNGVGTASRPFARARARAGAQGVSIGDLQGALGATPVFQVKSWQKGKRTWTVQLGQLSKTKRREPPRFRKAFEPSAQLARKPGFIVGNHLFAR